MEHNILPDMIAFRSDLAAHNGQQSVFGLRFNVFENLQRDFPVLGCFTGIDSLDDIGLFLVNPSGLDKIAASRIAL